MAKGAYQIGVLRALSEYVPRGEIKYISCASIGVLNGYAYLVDNLDRAEKIWRHVCDNDARLIISKILRSNMLQQSISDIYDAGEKIQSAFYCALLDWCHKSVVYKDLSHVAPEEISLWLKAAVTMPAYNRAVEIDGVSYYDGALVDNIPVFPLIRHNLDYIICVYFDDSGYKFENAYIDGRIIKVCFPASGLTKSVILRPNNIDAMISEGYDKAKFLFGVMFRDGYQNSDHIYRSIEYFNQNFVVRHSRVTGDVIVDNLNKLTRRFVCRKIL